MCIAELPNIRMAQYLILRTTFEAKSKLSALTNFVFSRLFRLGIHIFTYIGKNNIDAVNGKDLHFL